MNTSDPGWMSATEMAAQVASKSLSPNEIAEEMIRRVDEINPAVNAIVHFDADQVRRDAAELTRAQASGEQLGPLLHGVPFTIKDLNRRPRSPDHIRSEAHARQHRRARRGDRDPVAAGRRPVSRQDQPRRRAATTAAPTTPLRSDPQPVEARPHRGWIEWCAAAAVAAGLGPLAEGSDGAGSVRIPSALCGVVGLKPRPA